MTVQKAVTLIGAGNMGGAMAANLLGKGWGVQVCDIDPVKVADLERIGAVALSHPAQAAIDSVAFIICVVDATQTGAVLFGAQGLARMLRPGHAVMLCPTMAPQDVESFASRLAERGDFLGSEPKFSQPKADPSGATHGVAEKLVSDPNKSCRAGRRGRATAP